MQARGGSSARPLEAGTARSGIRTSWWRKLLTLGTGMPLGFLLFEVLVQLEHLLNARPERSMSVESIKLGMSRYYPLPERLVLASYGLRYDPDLVLVGVLPNDVIDTYLGLDAISVSPFGFLISREAKCLGAGYSVIARAIFTEPIRSKLVP